MNRSRTPRPTDAELAILKVLWVRGATTVRQVHEELVSKRETGYTTTLKLMQIMTEKGLVTRDETDRAHVYRARFTEQRVGRELLTDLADRLFGGSAAGLAIQALSSKRATAEELAELREWLDRAEGVSK